MPDDEPRKSMVGAPPSTRRGRGGNTPAAGSSTPVAPRTSARAAKRVKKEEVEDEEFKDDQSDAEKSEEESDDSGDDAATPSRKGAGGAGTRKRKRVPLTDYHLKKKKILARKAQREAEKERERDLGIEEEDEEPVEKEPTPPPVRKPPSYSSFTGIQLMQDHILRKLVEKDPDQYFAFPVTPSMAPDYTDVIKNPMDLQTIREKIEDGKYSSLPEMRTDCHLIVENAMQYNQPNTVFYLAASRLSNLINYYFGEQYLRFLFHTLPFANKIPFELIGIRPLGPVSSQRHMNKRRSVVNDGMTVDECFQNADEKVRDKLSAQVPEQADGQKKAKLGFLSERNGTVVLNVVAGYSEDRITENNLPRKVTLGDLVGPLEEGTTGMIQMADHRLYSQAPMNYLNYGAFSSFAPMFDSTWSTMTKEDTDLFLRTYGDKSNTSDVISMRSYVGNCPEFADMVESLLDSLTDGEHSRAAKELSKDGESKIDTLEVGEEFKNDSLLSLIDDVKSISNLGIETGFLQEVRQQVLAIEELQQDTENIPEYMIGMEHMNVQQQLNHIGQEIKDLAHLQEARLCQPPPTMLMNVQEAGPIEQKLAENVQQHLAHQITTHTAPEAFVNDAVIHNAMGVDIDEEDDLFQEFFVTSNKE